MKDQAHGLGAQMKMWRVNGNGLLASNGQLIFGEMESRVTVDPIVIIWKQIFLIIQIFEDGMTRRVAEIDICSFLKQLIA